MESRDSRVSLCSAGRVHEAHSLREELRGLGFEVDLLEAERAPSAAGGGPRILFGEPRVVPLAPPPRASAGWELGIFPREAGLPRDAVLSCCADFMLWPAPSRELETRVRRACALHHQPLAGTDDPGLAEFGLVGDSPAFRAATALIRRFAACDAGILIQGETGTGKELAARAIHYLGPRHDHPFIPLNCGAVPDHLFENELFGHERGAYTDAREAHPGLVAQAEGGTLFLDEVDALSPKAQVALMRFLQEREYRPLGSGRVRRADVRVVAACNRDLLRLQGEGGFRADLVFRLNVLALALPPLRERGDDLVWMQQRAWPGNVRELESVLHRAFLVTDGDTVEAPGWLVAGTVPDAGGRRAPPTFSEGKLRAIADFERRYLEALLRETDGNVSQAARIAGKERRALGKLIKKHGLDRQRFSA